MANSQLITSRFKHFDGSKEYKAELQSALFKVMKECNFFKLRRNKVLIKNVNSETKNKFVILTVHFVCENAYYCCPLCSDQKIVDCLSESCSPETLPSCIHSDVCRILWGEDIAIENDIDEESSIIEIIKQEPIYMAAVHPPMQSKKKLGLVVLTTKTLKPKCERTFVYTLKYVVTN